MELAAVNLESELDLRGNRLAWLSVKAINRDRLVKEVDRNCISLGQLIRKGFVN